LGKKENIEISFLVEECKNGNRRAQQKVYELFGGAMYGTALRITGNKMDAEDVLQEGFVDAFSKIDQLENNLKFPGWIKRIISNKALNLVKRKVDFTNDLPESKEEEYHERETNYTIDDVKSAMEKLSDGYRIVFSLYAFEGYSHKEISSELGISESTSKSQYLRAKTRIKEQLLKQVNYG
jgi:RNA polymerase sigma-70 factor (ECF subfamily)